MPIKPELRKKFYGREWRTITRPRILTRAGNCCEQCKKPNREVVETVSWNSIGAPMMLWRTLRATWWGWSNGRFSEVRATDRFFEGAAWRRDIRKVRVVLTIAHLNHTPGDDRDDNLKALCQWCHLNYDKLHHKQTRSARKDRTRPLLAMGGGA